ncbi:hypothetical protein ACJIZ3_018453 [Penstemon smallii]|uniref:AT-hook motif nuclear-localized protein n=1 Tax=Penstemon smallii TaxID=265156 RepID=A0ABD3SZ17_9LAMI
MGSRKTVKRVMKINRLRVSNMAASSDSVQRPQRRAVAIPQVMNIAAGEDIRRAVLAYARGRWATTIMSGSGTISAVDIKNVGSDGTSRHEGNFDIVYMTGIYNEGNDAPGGLLGGISIAFVGPDGNVKGGRVEGDLIAAGPFRVGH